MKLKNKGIYKYCIGFILGAIVFGGVGVLASTYILKSSEIEYKENKSVQEAVEELYTLVGNGGSTGSNSLITIGEISVKSLTVKIPYTGTYKDIKCLYGTDTNYGNRGAVSDNICTFMGTDGNQKLYYKLIATNDDGKIYEKSGSVTTGTETNVIVTDIPTGTKAIIYLDPTDITKTCNEQNSTSTTGTKSGCMKWYAYKETDDSYTMILDHNTTARVTGWSAASTQLTSDTTGWTGSPRLITGQEIADITGNTEWTSTGDWFYLDSNSASEGASKYYWLYDYTYNCPIYGCKVGDNSNGYMYGYWTSTSASSSYAWHVRYGGRLSNFSVSDTYSGVRPVITISKSNL